MSVLRSVIRLFGNLHEDTSFKERRKNPYLLTLFKQWFTCAEAVDIINCVFVAFRGILPFITKPGWRAVEISRA